MGNRALPQRHGAPRIVKVLGAVNIGSFRVSAMIAGLSESGEMIVLGSGHRASAGVKRGYVTDMQAATHAVRDAIERAEKIAGLSLNSVSIGCSGAGLASTVDEDLGVQGTDAEVMASDVMGDGTEDLTATDVDESGAGLDDGFGSTDRPAGT